MACSLSQDQTLGCKDIGGVVELYIGQWNDSSMGFTYATSSSTPNLITAFTGTTVSFYTFQQPINAAELTGPAEINTENNTIGYTGTLKFGVYSLQSGVLNIIQILGQGTFRVIAKARSGRYFILGVESPAQVTAIDSGIGKGVSDLNGAMITISSLGTLPFYEVSAAAAATVIA